MFLGQLPDSTGLIGSVPMGNEPGFHIPWLFNRLGRPHETQRRVRQLLKAWFRNDLMGIPGDEDGGAMSAWVVWSMLGLYPTVPGVPEYDLGSPVFPRVVLHLPNGRRLELLAPGVESGKKLVREVRLNGTPLGRWRVSHSELLGGGVLEFLP